MIDKFKGFFLVLLVVLLSAVFALQFGGGQAEGCAAGGSTYLARVYDQTLSKGDFEAAYAVANFGRLPEETQRSMRLPELVLDGLIDRTLLAREARKVGFDVSQDEVMTRFVNEGIILLSLGVGAPPMLPQGEIPVSFADKEGAFNKDLAERYIQNGLRRSVGEFADAQVDEYLAAQMRELIASSVNVSEAEVWDDYVRENDNAKIKYIRFSPAYYVKEKPATSEAALTAWISGNEERLAAEYEANKHRYTNLEKQVRARQILIKAGSNATAEQKAEAKKRAGALQKRAVKGEGFRRAWPASSAKTQSRRKTAETSGFSERAPCPNHSTRRRSRWRWTRSRKLSKRPTVSMWSRYWRFVRVTCRPTRPSESSPRASTKPTGSKPAPVKQRQAHLPLGRRARTTTRLRRC